MRIRKITNEFAYDKRKNILERRSKHRRDQHVKDISIAFNIPKRAVDILSNPILLPLLIIIFTFISAYLFNNKIIDWRLATLIGVVPLFLLVVSWLIKSFILNLKNIRNFYDRGCDFYHQRIVKDTGLEN